MLVQEHRCFFFFLLFFIFFKQIRISLLSGPLRDPGNVTWGGLLEERCCYNFVKHPTYHKDRQRTLPKKQGILVQSRDNGHEYTSVRIIDVYFMYLCIAKCNLLGPIERLDPKGRENIYVSRNWRNFSICLNLSR